MILLRLDLVMLTEVIAVTIGFTIPMCISRLCTCNRIAELGVLTLPSRINLLLVGVDAEWVDSGVNAAKYPATIKVL